MHGHTCTISVAWYCSSSGRVKDLLAQFLLKSINKVCPDPVSVVKDVVIPDVLSKHQSTMFMLSSLYIRLAIRTITP